MQTNNDIALQENAGGSNGGRKGNRRILVADDERHIVRLLRTNLERAGYAVSVAYDSKEVLEQAAITRPDLIIMADKMDGVDSYDTVLTLRSRSAWRKLPLILTTADRKEAAVVRGWAAGVDAYLAKPIQTAELLAYAHRIFQSIDEDNG